MGFFQEAYSSVLGFFHHCDIFSLLVGVFRPFSLKVISNIVGINVYYIHILCFTPPFFGVIFVLIPKNPLYILDISLLFTLCIVLIISDISFILI